MRSPERRRLFGDIAIHAHHRETLEICAESLDVRGRRADQKLDPGHDADRRILVAGDLTSGVVYAKQVIDQDVAIEQRLYHSLRRRSW
jgi:hypothetical protein